MGCGIPDIYVWIYLHYCINYLACEKELSGIKVGTWQELSQGREILTRPEYVVYKKFTPSPSVGYHTPWFCFSMRISSLDPSSALVGGHLGSWITEALWLLALPVLSLPRLSAWPLNPPQSLSMKWDGRYRVWKGLETRQKREKQGWWDRKGGWGVQGWKTEKD